MFAAFLFRILAEVNTLSRGANMPKTVMVSYLVFGPPMPPSYFIQDVGIGTAPMEYYILTRHMHL